MTTAVHSLPSENCIMIFIISKENQRFQWNKIKRYDFNGKVECHFYLIEKRTPTHWHTSHVEFTLVQEDHMLFSMSMLHSHLHSHIRTTRPSGQPIDSISIISSSITILILFILSSLREVKGERWTNSTELNPDFFIIISSCFFSLLTFYSFQYDIILNSTISLIDFNSIYSCKQA